MQLQEVTRGCLASWGNHRTALSVYGKWDNHGTVLFLRGRRGTWTVLESSCGVWRIRTIIQTVLHVLGIQDVCQSNQKWVEVRYDIQFLSLRTFSGFLWKQADTRYYFSSHRQTDWWRGSHVYVSTCWYAGDILVQCIQDQHLPSVVLRFNSASVQLRPTWSLAGC